MNNEFLSRKVAVTGATGMVGSHLVAEMLRVGYTNITLIVRDSKRLSNMKATFDRLGIEPPAGVITVVETCLDDHESLSQKITDIDTIFHCAARIMSGNMTSQELVDNNVGIARGVTNWAISTGVRKIIHISSISALEISQGNIITEECLAINPDTFPAYGKSKFYSEQEIWRAADNGIETIVVMPGVILGEGNPTDNNSAVMVPVISSGIPFYTNGIMSYVDVRDVARAMVTLDAAQGVAGERFILSSDSASYKELITTAAKIARRPTPFIPIGIRIITAAYYAMRGVIKLGIIKDNGVTKENLMSILRSVKYDGSKIERMCGFSYVPLKTTLERVVKDCHQKQ